MPTYVFECSCGHNFEKSYPMAESSTARPTCPLCGKIECERNYSECVSIVSSIPHTLGSRADKNTSKFSEYEKHSIRRQNTEYMRQPSRMPLPEGASRMPLDADGNRIIPKD